MVHPVPIVSSRYVTSDCNSLDLVIVREPFNPSRGNFMVTNANGRVMFNVIGDFLSLADRRVLCDLNGTPILSFQRKHGYILDQWDVFRGSSNERIFRTKRTCFVPCKTTLEVFLGGNTNENVWDFLVRGTLFNNSCTIYARDGTTVVAKMQKKHSVESIALRKDTFRVRVFPNVDYAFIVALVVILDQSKINKQFT
ncbi:LURP-one-related 15-like protein [Tanacetum coccineum]|uniref:LURP-one-related 15-like protein n=1 Tax=Tanacetum coccineum TaxID=301880 RepID=A0ABQ5C6Z7_9ASTR